jgi:arylformamidase
VKRIIDLSHQIRQGMPVYPGDAGVEVARVVEWDDAGYNLTRLTMSAHAGTHVDAPFHFVRDGATVDQLCLSTLVGPAELLELGELAPNSDITAAMLEPFAGRVCAGRRILLRTGWSKRFGEPGFFSEHPNMTLDAAEWLAGHKIALLGMEQPSVHTKANMAVHRVLLGAGIVLVENLTNLDQVSGDQVYMVALPMNLVGCDGAPARVVALVDSPE